jgi:hypothetical protein
LCFVNVGLRNFISECGLGGIRKSAPISRFLPSVGSRVMRVQFVGRVIPDVLKITIENYPGFTWVSTAHKASWNFSLSIKHGAVTVACELPDFEQEKHFIDLYLRAHDLAYTVLDLTSFATGKHHRLLFEKMILPNGAVTDIVDVFPVSPLLNSAAITHPDDLDTLLRIVGGEPHLFRTLRYLISGTMEPHMSAINCGRVVEALRQIIAPKLDRKQGWAELRNVLRVDRSYIDLLTTSSIDSRHGGFTRIEGDVTMEIATRAWTLVNRYLEFRKRGNQPLPAAEFPVLS